MIDLESLGKEGIIKKDVYKELFSISEIPERQERKNEIILRAKTLGVAKMVENTIKSMEQDERRRRIEANKNEANRRTRSTEFSFDSSDEKIYPDMLCGTWLANDDGVWAMNSEEVGAQACYHPILPVRRLKNMEDGKEQLTVAYKRNGAWSELTVPKSMVCKASTIVDLADYGISVTSENAKLLVKYLSDLENWNEPIIPVNRSTSKMGWRKDNTGKQVFLPYDTDIVFDGEMKFRELYDSVTEYGDYQIWLDHAKKIRSGYYLEPRIAIAASFASALLKMTDTLSFIVDFWGSTEGGKTVTLMLAASVWGNPGEGQYIGTFKSTNVALETRCDLLHSLPLILDDSSNTSKNVREGMAEIVYALCQGKGQARSNKKLGAERDRYWNNCTICNGERPLSGYVDQGGAINRIIEIECGNKLFENPKQTVDIVKRNFGFAGKIFVEKLKSMSASELIEIQKQYESELTTADSMQKQVLAMSAILAADKIATDCIFQDGNNLSAKEVARFLQDRKSVSEGMRCYQYVLDVIESQGQHFDIQFSNIDQWGELDSVDGQKVVKFNITSLEKILSQNGFYRKHFTSWLKRVCLLIHDKDRDTKTVRTTGGTRKIIMIKIVPDFEETNDSGWNPVTDDNTVFD